jgi:hypothetical protein
MKIVGIIEYNIKRDESWNGEAIRTKKSGGSGTDQSFLLVAEYLASSGHDVFLSYNNIIADSEYNNVKYISEQKLREISETIDIIIIASWNHEFINFNWKTLKTLVIWCHYQGFIDFKLISLFKCIYPNVKIYINILSDFVKKYLDKYHPYYKEIGDKVIQIDNPLMLDLYSNTLTEKQKHMFIFFATFERGGEIAMNAFNRLNYTDKQMFYSNHTKYEINNFPGNNRNLIPLKWTDKQTIFDLLKRSEYFIYPLVLPAHRGHLLHKDTDGCVVAEALLHEVIVLTYPVGALKEKYSDHLIYLPYPPGANIELIEGVDQCSTPEFYSDFVIDSIVKTVDFLESNSHLKEILKKRGKEYIISKRNEEEIKTQWSQIVV